MKRNLRECSLRDPLAAALAQLRLDEEIPDELFTAVAIVLAWAYWLQGLEPQGSV